MKMTHPVGIAAVRAPRPSLHGRLIPTVPILLGFLALSRPVAAGPPPPGPDIDCPFHLSAAALDTLARTGFVILPDTRKEMYEYYTEIYPFYTTDAVFHTYVSLVRALLTDLESLVLEPELRSTSRALLEACRDQAVRLRGTPLESAAWTNAAVFAVPVVLLDGRDPGQLGLPEHSLGEVRKELGRIRASSAVTRSELIGGQEDYRAYRPVGRYAEHPALVPYFRAAVFLGRREWLVKSPSDVVGALVLLDAITGDRELWDRLQQMEALRDRLFGPPDDITLAKARELADVLAVGTFSTETEHPYRRLAESPLRVTRYRKALESTPDPRVNPLPGGADWRGETKGVRILGQRYTRTADLLQQYLDRGVWPLSGLVVPARLLGSEHARTLLPEICRSLRAITPPSPFADPYRGLNEGALHCLSALFSLPKEVPPFMKGARWEEKEINTALGGWTETAQATAGYVKDAHITMGGFAIADRAYGYVEPVPLFYARMDSLILRTLSVLDDVGLFPAIDSTKAAAERRYRESRSNRSLGDEDRMALYEETLHPDRVICEELSTVYRRLGELAGKELAGEPFSPGDNKYLIQLGTRMKALAAVYTHFPEPMASIATPATEYQSGTCFQIAVGRPAAIYVAVPQGGKKYVYCGAVYSYSEFTVPRGRELGPGDWKALAAKNRTGPVPPWYRERLSAPD